MTLLRRINLLKILLPFLCLLFLFALVKKEIINIPNSFHQDDIQMLTQAPFRGLGKDTLGEEFNIYQDDKSLFPERLGDMRLIKVIKDDEALANVQRFQGTTIDIARAYIPHYQIGTRQAIIWITESYHEEDARDLIKKMTQAIPKNEKFFNYEVYYDNGIKVYRAESKDWVNYFYQKGNGVYWVSIQDDTPNDVLSLVLEDI
ncbi:hypothetical protein [Candidatus Contubernalis alkaliaceticus]|uniref:hypothetical protein n=1 Tax=Candidatus Contubernalis alkaliaceticus TaxID=338645 RepID=UPI001F4BE9C3|nr:hypothetical protein [Candidatus Contubernalis alkalaceticus]UNC92906.1 hypothetical protein HUE98_12845 [Candidatus Contubernalis alkalaceticus]